MYASEAKRYTESSTYLPYSAEDLAGFLVHHGDLPELEVYNWVGDPSHKLAVANEIAAKLFHPGVDADSLVELYLLTSVQEACILDPKLPETATG